MKCSSFTEKENAEVYRILKSRKATIWVIKLAIWTNKNPVYLAKSVLKLKKSAIKYLQNN